MSHLKLTIIAIAVALGTGFSVTQALAVDPADLDTFAREIESAANRLADRLYRVESDTRLSLEKKGQLKLRAEEVFVREATGEVEQLNAKIAVSGGGGLAQCPIPAYSVGAVAFQTHACSIYAVNNTPIGALCC